MVALYRLVGQLGWRDVSRSAKYWNSTLRKRRNMLSKLRTKPMYEIENVVLKVKFLFCKSYGHRWAKEASCAPAATLNSSICFQTWKLETEISKIPHFLQTEQNNQNQKFSNSFLGNAQGGKWHSAGRVERAISSIQPGGSRLIQERNIFHLFFFATFSTHQKYSATTTHFFLPLLSTFGLCV